MPRSWPSSASVRISETIAEQPEPIITPTSSSAVEPSPRRRRRGARETAPEQAEQQRRRGGRADRRAAGDAPLGKLQPRRAGEEHRAERADRGAAGDAEHVGVGERVARQQLHQRAGERERRAGAEAGEDARHADRAR